MLKLISKLSGDLNSIFYNIKIGDLNSIFYDIKIGDIDSILYNVKIVKDLDSILSMSLKLLLNY